MKTSTPRLHSVRPKNGGATIRVIRPAPSSEAREIAKSLSSVGSRMADLLVEHAGYVLVAWQANGKASFAYRSGSNSPYARSTLPSIAADLMRSHITAELTIERMNGR